MFAERLGPSKGQNCGAVASFAFTTPFNFVCLKSTSHQIVIGLGFCGVGGLFLTMCRGFNEMQKNGMKIGF